MHCKLAMAMLCYSRPVHASLTLAFALVNKSEYTDLFAVYGINKDDKPVSATMSKLLAAVEPFGVKTIYRTEGYDANVGGGVDTLMRTMDSMEGYDCYFKIDDDVLIGAHTDIQMADMLLALERDNVYMLMAQAVPQHIRERVPFCWEANINGYRVVERSNAACPMETYTAVSNKCLGHLRKHGINDSCDNTRGVYGYYVRKLANLGARSALVLTPAIQMQHIGLTTTIEVVESRRGWAPARSWAPREQIIEVPFLDFAEWEKSHKTNTQREFAMATIIKLRNSSSHKHHTALSAILSVLEAYEPKDKPIKLEAQAPRVSRVDRVKRMGKDGRVIQKPEAPTAPSASTRSISIVEGRTVMRVAADGTAVRVRRALRKVVVRKVHA